MIYLLTLFLLIFLLLFGSTNSWLNFVLLVFLYCCSSSYFLNCHLWLRVLFISIFFVLWLTWWNNFRFWTVNNSWLFLILWTLLLQLKFIVSYSCFISLLRFVLSCSNLSHLRLILFYLYCLLLAVNSLLRRLYILLSLIYSLRFLLRFISMNTYLLWILKWFSSRALIKIFMLNLLLQFRFIILLFVLFYLITLYILLIKHLWFYANRNISLIHIVIDKRINCLPIRFWIVSFLL